MSYYSLISLMPKSTGIDPDAQAFITAASITDPTQQSAINQLVVDLKGYNIWTKMKAIYPIVGGVASSHAVNLKTPGTFNLTFATGWTHASTGMTPLNTYANTFLIPSTALSSINNVHLSNYSRTQNSSISGHDMGVDTVGTNLNLSQYFASVNVKLFMNGGYPNGSAEFNETNTRGLAIGSATSSTLRKLYFNGNLLNTDTNTQSTTLPISNLYLGSGRDATGAANYFSSRQIAFASIGDGLTDTEAVNLYTAVQAFQTTLGRSIGTQTVSDADAQAFVNAANITDQVEANAINNLVIGLKADGLWTKMKAIYPIVGGVASSHAVNLKTPGTYNLTFSTGWTHSSTGMTPNGTSAFANTNLTPSTAMPSGGDSLHYYSRTNSTTTGDNLIAGELGAPYRALILSGKNTSGLGSYFTTNPSSTYQSASQTDVSRDTRGLFGGTSNGTNTYFYLNGVQLANNTTAQTYTARYSAVLFIGAKRNNSGGAVNFTNKECAYASIGEGLTDTEAANFYTAVQTFQTALNRQV